MLDAFVGGDRIGEPLALVVAIDQQFTRHIAAGEGDDARIAVEFGIGDEARHQPRMQRAEIAHRVPDVVGAGVEGDVFVDGSHGSVFL